MVHIFGRRAMNGYNFTERARKALALARDEAARLHHEYIGTEHILLGLLREGDGVAIDVIQNLGADPDELRNRIEEVVKPGREAATGPDLPYTSRGKKVFELAMEEARDLNHSYVGTEHLLLGLLHERGNVAAQVLNAAGITLEGARDETLRVLGAPDAARGMTIERGRQASMRPWPPPAGDSPSASMAASVIELLAQDSGVNAVFAAQGIDVARLVAALRTFAPPATGDAAGQP